MSVPDSGRGGVPVWRALASALPRPRLFSVLDQGSPLTLLDAPPGFGKRTLLASWLHAGGAPERTVVWVPPSAEDAVHDDTWRAVLVTLHEHGAFGEPGAAEEPSPSAPPGGDPFPRVVQAFREFGAPALLVLSGVYATDEVLSCVVELLDRCSFLDVIVCLPGTLVHFSALADRGNLCTYISTEQMAFTAAETAQVFRDAGAGRTDDECAALHRILGGVPEQITAAVTLARTTPHPLVDAHGVPKARLARVVEGLAERRLAMLDDEARRFALSIVAAHSTTATDAAELTHHPDPAPTLDAMTVRGLLFTSRHDHRWRWTDAMRSAVLKISREARPGHVDALLADLARAHRRDGDPVGAAAYAVEATEWDMAAAIIEESWVDMVDSHFDVLVKILREIPERALLDHPSILAGRALFTQMLDEHAILHSSLPVESTELYELGRTKNADQSLHVGTVQSLTLRVAGDLDEAARLTMRLQSLVESILEHQPDVIGAQLPVLRVQWAITLQLAGFLPESTAIFRRAYKGAHAAGIAFAAQNAAGSSALNWAVAGDDPRAREWLRTEARCESTDGYWGAMVKVGGLTASALLHLDELDLDSAGALLDQLGTPRESEELWGFVAYCRVYHALARGNAYDGLTGVHQAIAAHLDRHTEGAFSRILLGAAEVDLQLALGNGNLAHSLAREDSRDHPLLVVTRARVELLTGHPDVASKQLRGVSWTDCGYPRAHLEALLVDAAARLDLEDENEAVLNWQRACVLALSLGNRRAFTTVPAHTVQRLEELSGTSTPGGPVRPIFTDKIFRVELSPRETDVLLLLVQGSTHSDIAKKLFVSPNTVKTQLRSIYRKLDAHSRTEAIARARELRLLPVTGA